MFGRIFGLPVSGNKNRAKGNRRTRTFGRPCPDLLIFYALIATAKVKWTFEYQ